MKVKDKMNNKNKRIDFIINELLVADMPYRYSSNHGGEVLTEGYGENELSLITYDVGSLVKRTFAPSHPFLFNLGAGFSDGDERLFSTDKDFLITDLQSVLNGGYEFTMICDTKIKWIKFVQADTQRYKNLSTVPFSDVYEVHYREKSILSGETDYIRDFFSVRKNKSLPVRFGDLVYSELISDENHFTQAMLAASSKEDSFRSGVFHVKLTNKKTNTGVTLSVEPYEVIELMKFRDNPLTSGGNKRPILHWVKSHLKGEMKKTRVDKHLRGIGTFESDGYIVEIKEPDIKSNHFSCK